MKFPLDAQVSIRVYRIVLLLPITHGTEKGKTKETLAIEHDDNYTKGVYKQFDCGSSRATFLEPTLFPTSLQVQWQHC